MSILIRRTLQVAAVLLIAAACTKESRHGVDSQVEREDRNDSSSVDSSASADDAQQASSSSPGQGKGDVDFVLAAADAGLLEVRLGQLAAKQASSAETKSFARTMTIDHGKANDELTNLAGKLNITVQDNLSQKSQQKYDELAQMKGPAFDRAYAETMVADHQETIEKFRVEANNGQHPELRDWATAKIPNLEHHLMMAKKIDASMKTSAGR